ncbi:MAG: flavodoxin domain-containing protein [Anaerolineae bacterium]|nr:flavodoxin domain-containing protein [Anaerolineae bacterium]
MSETILIAYATRYGSTQEVAEQIAAVLRQNGLSVEVQAMRQVQSLENYRAVILGAPLYIGRWLKEAHKFLARHQQALVALPVALFVLGPTKTEEVNDPVVRAQLDQELGRVPWLKPVATELFGGKYDPAKLRFPDTLLKAFPASPLYNAPASDTRNWDAIRAWAASVASHLKAD